MKNTFVGVFVGVNVGVKNDKKWAFPGSFTLAGSGYTRFAPGALPCVMADSIRHLEPNSASLRPYGSLSLTQKATKLSFLRHLFLFALKQILSTYLSLVFRLQ